MVSFDEYEQRRKCGMRGCREEREDGPFCEEHAELVPEDLMYRLRWAYEEGDAMDRAAAMRAATLYIRDAITDALTEHATDKEAADALGLHPSTMYYHMKRNGISHRRPKE